MRTDRVQVELRRRNGMEAVDLGFRMANAWWRPLALCWALLVLPFGAVLVLTLREQPPYWTIGLLWLLRPVFARVPLHVLSRALFGEEVGLRDTLRALPALLRSGLGTSLVLQRLSPARTLLQPVLQLEGLRGPARRARCAALARRDMASAVGLMAVGSLVTGSLTLGLLLLCDLVLPEELGFSVFAWLDAGQPARVSMSAIYLLGISISEPLVVAGGFALYVNRRVYLEGWDIDLAFRQLARRVARSAAPRAAAVGLLPAAAFALAVLPVAASRAESACQPDDAGSAGACILEVLEGGEFGRTEEVTRWVPREFDSEPSLPGLDWLGEVVATAIELALWTGVALGAVALAAALVRRRDAARRQPAPRRAPPQLFGLALDPRSQPPDVVAAARECWARGAPIEALSLLYRGALVHLTARAELEIPESATELECIRLVRHTQAAELARSFAELTQAWVRTRYGRQPPSDADFDALCRGFQPAFGKAP